MLPRVSDCVAVITFQETFYCHHVDAGAVFIVSSHHFNINQSYKLLVVSLQICKISKFYSALFYSLFISHELTEIKSLSPRVVVQQIKTNVSAFYSRSQHILTCRSHYITHWKWPEMHVRLNQLAAQPLVQLRSWVGVVSVVCSVVSTGSQRSCKCWNQLSCPCHLSLSNGKSICVW